MNCVTRDKKIMPQQLPKTVLSSTWKRVKTDIRANLSSRIFWTRFKIWWGSPTKCYTVGDNGCLNMERKYEDCSISISLNTTYDMNIFTLGLVIIYVQKLIFTKLNLHKKQVYFSHLNFQTLCFSSLLQKWVPLRKLFAIFCYCLLQNQLISNAITVGISNL